MRFIQPLPCGHKAGFLPPTGCDKTCPYRGWYQYEWKGTTMWVSTYYRGRSLDQAEVIVDGPVENDHDLIDLVDGTLGGTCIDFGGKVVWDGNKAEVAAYTD